MKSARVVYVVLFAAATFASAAQLAAAVAGPSFAAPVFYNFTPGQPAGQVVAADLNGDGKLDLLIPVQCTPACLDGAVTVLLGNGDGTFRAAHNYGTGGPALSVVATDVNGDGKPDLLVPVWCGNSLCSTVSVLLGNGDGTFQAAVNYDTGGYDPLAVAVGDMNRDGKPDLVVVNSCVSTTNCSNGSVGVLLGNGDGTFQAAVVHSVAPSSFQAALVDVNGDGKLDLVGASLSGTVWVLLGNGDGTFQAAVSYSVDKYPRIAFADMNRDGKLDLVVAMAGGATGTGGVLLGNGDGTFQKEVRYTFGGGGSITSLTAVDVNQDGKPDVLVTSQCQGANCQTSDTGAVFVLLGNGDGTVQSPVSYSSGGEIPNPVTMGDVNGDGNPDIVISNRCASGTNCRVVSGTIGVLLSKGDGTFQGPAIYHLQPPLSAALGDVNGDGKLDILETGCGPGSCEVGVLINTLQVATKTTLASSLDPSHVNQSVTFTATVTGLYAGKTTGSVTFKQGTTVLGTAAVVGGKATITHVFTKTGKFSINGNFSGDSNNKASTSAVSQVVTP